MKVLKMEMTVEEYLKHLESVLMDDRMTDAAIASKLDAVEDLGGILRNLIDQNKTSGGLFHQACDIWERSQMRWIMSKKLEEEGLNPHRCQVFLQLQEELKKTPLEEEDAANAPPGGAPLRLHTLIFIPEPTRSVILNSAVSRSAIGDVWPSVAGPEPF